MDPSLPSSLAGSRPLRESSSSNTESGRHQLHQHHRLKDQALLLQGDDRLQPDSEVAGGLKPAATTTPPVHPIHQVGEENKENADPRKTSATASSPFRMHQHAVKVKDPTTATNHSKRSRSDASSSSSAYDNSTNTTTPPGRAKFLALGGDDPETPKSRKGSTSSAPALELLDRQDYDDDGDGFACADDMVLDGEDGEGDSEDFGPISGGPHPEQPFTAEPTTTAGSGEASAWSSSSSNRRRLSATKEEDEDEVSAMNTTSGSASSPLIMSSLFVNKVVFDHQPSNLGVDLLADSADNGASPMFSASGSVSSEIQQLQERRRLNFGGEEPLSSSGPNRRDENRFRRCTSMLESSSVARDGGPRPGSWRPQQEQDLASPVSRNSGFKRPMDPCCSSGNQSSAHLPESGAGAPQPSCDGQQSSKRRRSQEYRPGAAPPLVRSKSMLDPAQAAQIMQACSLADVESDLTGDTRSRLSLPTVSGSGKNRDLQNIDCHTMANVVLGKYGDRLSSYRIIDARYCYEFQGGHIRGAENFGSWDEEAFLAEFLPASKGAKKFEQESKRDKREILIFHCEFSSARGPALMRLLRQKDREVNKCTYPALHYPECYLLHEGYKTFFENYSELCEPKSYLPMAHPSYIHEERKFHRKSKSWAAGGGGTVSRTGASSRLLKL